MSGLCRVLRQYVAGYFGSNSDDGNVRSYMGAVIYDYSYSFGQDAPRR